MRRQLPYATAQENLSEQAGLMVWEGFPRRAYGNRVNGLTHH